MGKFFNPESFLWRGFGRIADFMFLSICFMVASVPIMTIPAAAIALYDATARCVYGNEAHPYGRFFRTFKAELLRSVGLTVLWGAAAFLLYVVYQILCQLASPMAALVYFFLMFVPVGMFCWVILVESRFVYSFGQLHKTALFFTFSHLPASLVIAVLGIATYVVCVNMPFFLMLLPGICAYIQSIFAEKVFVKYMPKEEA